MEEPFAEEASKSRNSGSLSPLGVAERSPRTARKGKNLLLAGISDRPERV
jgi:hypothetical protein